MEMTQRREDRSERCSIESTFLKLFPFFPFPLFPSYTPRSTVAALMVLASWCAVFVLAVAAASAAEPSIAWDADSGRAVLTNGPVELVVETASGINARSLRDLRSGQVYADRDYAWSVAGTSELPKMEGDPIVADTKDGGRAITFRGRLGAIGVQQTFTMPNDEPGVILERITISNPTDKTIDAASFRCGFAKSLRDGETWSRDASQIRFSPIPYRRETDGKMQEFPLREVAEHGTIFKGWVEPPTQTPIWGAEGWVWSSEGSGDRGQGTEGKGEGGQALNPEIPKSPNPESDSPHPNPLPKGEGTSAAFLIAKHNPVSMEWSLMEPIKRGKETILRFGGAGQWKYGSPEGSSRLEPGKSYTFGETRLQAIAGDWKQAFYAYRAYTESKGCRPPKDYNPPVHWNELYDNQYFFKVGAALGDQKAWYTPGFNADNEKLLAEFYSRDLILAEAAKAKELGCEALYLDPGWDTGPSHHIWDAERLGPMDAFVAKMKREYGLKVALWIGTGGMPPTYADPEACPIEARVVDKNGHRTQIHCFASPAFLDTKEKRLLELCRNGVAFMMFDSTQYSGPCYDKTHGHSIPSTREEHARALLELARRVKSKYPHLLIEMHDFISGPGSNHYTPTYFGYAPPYSHDCLWGHEFMWSSMDDLLSGRALSLYYYNLAYSIPIYLHVGLKPDNENALVFWWFASTCRHMGMGGKSPNAAVWEAQKRAMRTYLPLKRFYTQGVFYGIDETVHAHTLPELRESVLNVFNLGDKPVEKEVRFRLADIGLPTGSVQIEGASLSTIGDELTLKMPLPARGHQLVKIKVP
jgi:hypothetical protein